MRERIEVTSSFIRLTVAPGHVRTRHTIYRVFKIYGTLNSDFCTIYTILQFKNEIKKIKLTDYELLVFSTTKLYLLI